MLAGIGILIFGSQFHVMVDDVPQGSGLTNLVTIPNAIIKGLTPAESTPHHLAARVGAITLAVLIGWNVVKDKLPSAVSKVPAPLLAVTVATIAAQVMGLPIAYVQLPSDLSALITLPEMGAFSDLAKPAVLGTAVAIAIVASAESLLCAAAVDRMHSGEPSDLDKELVARVLAILLGLLGGRSPASFSVQQISKQAANSNVCNFPWWLALGYDHHPALGLANDSGFFARRDSCLYWVQTG